MTPEEKRFCDHTTQWLADNEPREMDDYERRVVNYLGFNGREFDEQRERIAEYRRIGYAPETASVLLRRYLTP